MMTRSALRIDGVGVRLALGAGMSPMSGPVLWQASMSRRSMASNPNGAATTLLGPMLGPMLGHVLGLGLNVGASRLMVG